MGQIYFLVATVVKADEQIAGYFPAHLFSRRSKHEVHIETKGIHFTSSDDGVRWSAPINVLPVTGYVNLNGKTIGLGGYRSIHPVGMFQNRLLTQDPQPIEESFKISQELHTIAVMKEPLTMSLLGRGHALLRAETYYNMSSWD